MGEYKGEIGDYGEKSGKNLPRPGYASDGARLSLEKAGGKSTRALPWTRLRLVQQTRDNRKKTWPAAFCPRRVTACPPAGHASAQASISRTRAPAGGAPWPACRLIKQDSRNQRKGSRGKNLFPWHSFPHFLWKKWGPAGGDPNNVAGSLLLSTEKRHLFRDGVFVIHPDRSGGQRR